MLLDLLPYTVDHYIKMIMKDFVIDRNTAATIFAKQYEIDPDFAEGVDKNDSFNRMMKR